MVPIYCRASKQMSVSLLISFAELEFDKQQKFKYGTFHVLHFITGKMLQVLHISQKNTISKFKEKNKIKNTEYLLHFIKIIIVQIFSFVDPTPPPQTHNIVHLKNISI